VEPTFRGPTGPIILVLPARNESAVIGSVLGRVPSVVDGHSVRVVVVDDGSTDTTGSIAIAHGATVVRNEASRGLGAAVRRGLTEARSYQPAAVAFCDADGEYAPEELAELVAPILRGQAHYVVGSRFAGRIDKMHLRRRVGNRVLTAALRRWAREPITDGQSGYRALSPAALDAFEIAHDYNYAQVLTCDLIAKGFGYAEVPISYSFRSTGSSFVRLVPYLRHVVPTLLRQRTTARSTDRLPRSDRPFQGPRRNAKRSPDWSSSI
jgi:glycosyltransferase involved in cell wall biosynthesis